MKKIRTETLLVIIISIVFGSLFGVFGYIAMGGGNFPFFGNVNIGDVGYDSQIIIDQPRNVTVEQDIQLRQVQNDVIPTLISIYRFKQSNNTLDKVYIPSDVLGNGVVITADGWVISTISVIGSLLGDYEIIGYQSKQYKISKFIEDKTTGIVFGKMESEDLPISKMGNSNDLSVGQTVAVISRLEGILLSNIKQIGYRFNLSSDIILSSEDLSREIILDITLDKSYDGSVVVNLKGEVVGVFTNGKVIPVNYFKGIISQILENQKIARPRLGIRYIDLSQVDGLIEVGDRGALVYGNPPLSSPAHQLVFDGDIIIKMDDIELNSSRNLSELISGYRIGDSVELLIRRSGEELAVEVELQ